MCGRFTRLYSWRVLQELMDLRFPPPEEMRPTWNMAPSQCTPVCRLDAQGNRQVVPMRWGFTPRWSKDGKPGPINARSETAATSAMFKGAYESRRCLVPVSGFYEWGQTVSGKRPHYIRLPTSPAFSFAGLWERWSDDDAAVDSFAVLTTRPNALLASIHDRMPVIVRREEYAAWLAVGQPPAHLFEPFAAEHMEMYPVSSRVNSPRADDPGLCEPATGDYGLFDAPA